MSIATNDIAAGHAHGAHDAGHGGHSPFLAHHFDTPDQQFASGKLGMWVFLGTELLMFGGLFVAYAVYRHNHPDVFLYAHHYLDKNWGAINTVILLVSSFTMAWAVRCSQLGRNKAVAVLCGLTILGGAGFMCIKYIEYKSKWEHQLFPGRANVFHKEFEGDRTQSIEHLEHYQMHGAGTSAAATHDAKSESALHPKQHPDTHGASNGSAAATAREEPARSLYVDPNAGTGDEAKIKPTFSLAGSGVASSMLDPAHATGGHGIKAFESLELRDQARVNTFFSVYFLMTGLHGLHVLVGMALIGWVMLKAMGGIFGPAYYTPVDLVGLYWHLVDLIWIFLFPLLYLIH